MGALPRTEKYVGERLKDIAETTSGVAAQAGDRWPYYGETVDGRGFYMSREQYDAWRSLNPAEHKPINLRGNAFREMTERVPAYRGGGAETPPDQVAKVYEVPPSLEQAQAALTDVAEKLRSTIEAGKDVKPFEGVGEELQTALKGVVPKSVDVKTKLPEWSELPSWARYAGQAHRRAARQEASTGRARPTSHSRDVA
jgi:hypothetical protein